MINIDQITKEGYERWPQLSVALDPEPAMEFLEGWCSANEPSVDGAKRMKEALREYLMERFKEVCVSELIDALAENVSCIMLEEFIKQIKKEKL